VEESVHRATSDLIPCPLDSFRFGPERAEKNGAGPGYRTSTIFRVSEVSPACRR